MQNLEVVSHVISQCQMQPLCRDVGTAVLLKILEYDARGHVCTGWSARSPKH